MRLCLLVIVLSATCTSVFSQCRSGLVVFNRTHFPILPLSSCNEVVDIKSLAEEPTVHYNRANFSETYLLMLLEAHPNNHDMYTLHWLLSGIKSQGMVLNTRNGVRDLAKGYSPPVNQTHYEFRLYNMTGKTIWDEVNQGEKKFFLPLQWLKAKSIYSEPLAMTAFNVKALIPGPSGWVVPAHPVGIQPPTYGQHPPPAHYPPQPPPQSGQHPPPAHYPPQPPPQSGQHPPPAHYPPQPPPQSGQHPPPAHYPPQPPPQSGHPSQHLPNYPTQPPHHPQPAVPHYPVQQVPPPHPQPAYPSGQPHPQPYPPQHPPPNQYPAHHPTDVKLQLQQTYSINGTYFRLLSHDRSPHNVLNINSTLYTSDTYNKRFKLTRYLIIDNKSYIWRNQTHSPGNGPSIYINSTLYVPFNPSKEIHHYHYHKGSASSLNPTLAVFIILIPYLFSSFQS